MWLIRACYTATYLLQDRSTEVFTTIGLPICFLQAEITLLRLVSDLIDCKVGAELFRGWQKLEVPNDEDHEHT